MSEEMKVADSFELAIVGCGPAGLSAAINGAIRKKKVAIFGTEFCSPKLHHAPHIDNYLGLPQITGEELRKKFLEHLQVMKLEIRNSKISGIYPQEGGFILQSRDIFYQATSVILATGVSTVKPINQELDYLGRGVAYCSTCDGPLYKGKRVIVLAYNREGLEEANFLAEIAAEVLLVPVLKDEDAKGIELNQKIQIIKGKPMGIIGEMWATGVALDGQDLTADGIFIVRDSVLPDQLVPGLEVSNKGIIVDRGCATNIPGVFAAGDCTGVPYQLCKAAGEGQVAALSAVKYLDELKHKE
ncbi:NAD(P)/FAD-dependent oxidoreductase [Desulforamulus aquiferis]|uniref:NAD(P)/FAD-dependent oxidoreductase n=1 Tax=Desulforamulus aquiferis TaxID=1397668 RepID=A0AAW7Z9P1_9FIRM|nr:NAD(P)/FAD-dependent oxidoreductase [Desulforamulus aquiferis]MDO7786130.1 NAD(P)/FAD-dependent oxidoreductase [Desulforamulus aquiferis]RYD04484.1 thioredoxin reductase [Desulforamulus aquiferis]